MLKLLGLPAFLPLRGSVATSLIPVTNSRLGPFTSLLTDGLPPTCLLSSPTQFTLCVVARLIGDAPSWWLASFMYHQAPGRARTLPEPGSASLSASSLPPSLTCLARVLEVVALRALHPAELLLSLRASGSVVLAARYLHPPLLPSRCAIAVLCDR